MDRVLYIAEIDEDGHIDWVWVKRPDILAPHQFQPQKDIYDPDEPAEFSGAPDFVIKSWLAATQGPEANLSDRAKPGSFKNLH